MKKEMSVIFGTGPLGISVMQALRQRGKPMRMVNRSGKAPRGVPQDIEITAGDAYNLDFNRRVTADAAVVYQCAQPPYHEWVQKFPDLQAAILEAAAENDASLVVGENLYMYGQVNGPIHEGLPYAARTRKGQVRAAMAESLLEAHRSGKVKVAIGRGSDFYGPNVLGSALGERTILPALKGKPAEVTGALDQPHTYTYIEDFGEALVLLAENQAAWGEAWHVPNPPTLTQGELVHLFFEEIELPQKTTVMGKTMLRIGGLFVPAAREMVEMMYQFEKPFVVDSSKFVQAFGDIATPHAEAVKRTVNWYRQLV